MTLSDYFKSKDRTFRTTQRKRSKSKQITCYCNALPYPHRDGSNPNCYFHPVVIADRANKRK